MNSTLRLVRSHAAAWSVVVLPSLALGDASVPVRYQYDAAGNLVRRIDPRGVESVQQFDRFNQPVRRLLPAPEPGAAQPVLAMAYDHQGNLAALADPRGLPTTWQSDGLGNLLAIDSPDSGATRVQYDQAGGVASVRDARGLVTSYGQDTLGRIVRIDTPGGTPTRFEYDSGGGGATGRLTRMVDESGQARYRYDEAGRLVEKTQEHRGRHGDVLLVVGYAYGTSGGATGKLESVTYPSGNRVVLGYSSSGKLTAMTLFPPRRRNPLTLLDQVGYEPFGPAKGWEWGRRDHEPTLYLRERDLDGRLVRYALGSKKAHGIVRTVVYDAAGRVERYLHDGDKRKGIPADQSFRYDDLDRLTGFVSHASAHAYRYDESGNRSTATLGHEAYSYSVDGRSNHLLASRGERGAARSYRYDAAGNVEHDGRLQFTYGAAGRVRSVRGDGWEATYLYNGMGQRVAKLGDPDVVPGGARFFVHDEDGRMLGEYDAKGHPVEETVFLGDTPVVVLAPASEQSDESSTKVHYVFADHLGSPRLIERADSGTVVWRWHDADPFGMAAPEGEHSSPKRSLYNRRFPGQYYDAETGLYFEQGRSYDPLAGRYGQSAPYARAHQRANPYAVNDPLRELAARPGGAAPSAPGWREWIGDLASDPAACAADARPAGPPPAWQPPAPVPGSGQVALTRLIPVAMPVR